MNDFLREAVSVYHNIAERDLRLILLQRSERILPEVTASLAAFAHKLLVKRGVEIRLGADLKAVTANAVIVEDKQATRPKQSAHARPLRPCRRVLIQSSQHSPLPQNKGRIVVDQTTEVPGWPGVWAIGDCAAIKQVDGNISPPTAHHALRQAKTCAGKYRCLLPRRHQKALSLHRAWKAWIAWPPIGSR